MKKLSFLLFFILFSKIVISQSIDTLKPEIDYIKKHVEFLASDSLKGRKPGTVESKIAAEYILEQFKSNGLVPMGDKGFQYFNVVTDVKTGENNYFSFNDFEGVLNNDFIPFSFSENKSVEANVVFAGYGFDIKSDSITWNDYNDIVVKDKWVMILRGDPELDNPNSIFIKYSIDRHKVLIAKDKGAAGVLLISGAEMEKKDELISLYYDQTSGGAGVPVINIKREVADKILEESDKTIESLEKTLNTNKKPNSFDLEIKVKASSEIIKTYVQTQNVIAIIEGNDPELKNEYIFIGAHYDHLGFGGQGTSSRKKDTVAVHNGADDNASGVAGVIELTKKLSLIKDDIKRSIVFMTFGAEEMGLLGSKYFVNNPLVEIDNITTMFNFDMIGRLKPDNKTVTIGGSGTSEESDSLIMQFAKDRIFKVNLSPDGYGPSDHASFYANDIPVFFISTGAHEDYHTPEDDVDKLDFKGETAIIDFAYELILNITNCDKKLTFSESGSKISYRHGRGLKIVLGIIPDFASSEKNGLGVDGVKKGGPADLGGMKKGDIIIAINGQAVTNIYDYMYRLANLKHGETAIVEVLRNEEKIVLLIQL
ncbi:MAG: M20/M25/M40 family metallo-hydrolase [Bacteroidales bacterium]|nr:M20/M25/M40 family metallo-hydrolase [Bacteroidales bacterium]